MNSYIENIKKVKKVDPKLLVENPELALSPIPVSPSEYDRYRSQVRELEADKTLNEKQKQERVYDLSKNFRKECEETD